MELILLLVLIGMFCGGSNKKSPVAVGLRKMIRGWTMPGSMTMTREFEGADKLCDI